MRVATLILAVGVLQETPSLETMLERLFSYVTAYEAHLSELIADEEMEQNRLDAAGAFGMTASGAWRKWKSEIAFVRLPGEGAWLGYRNVIVVDGRRVRDDNVRLQKLLASAVGTRDPSAPPSSLKVSFAPQAEVGILVPVRMHEIYPYRYGRGNGDARYSNFHRFATSARVVPQP